MMSVYANATIGKAFDRDVIDYCATAGFRYRW
jgi:hypothetical protein